jgi:general secretion pathway protein G
MPPRTSDPAPGSSNRPLGTILLLLLLLGLLLLWIGLRVGFRPEASGHQSDLYKRSKARADIAAIMGAITSYALDHEGRGPASLEALIERDSKGWTYLDIDSIPRDPWGTEYVYSPPRAGELEFRVLSYGKDGLPGGEGEDAEVEIAGTLDGQ